MGKFRHRDTHTERKCHVKMKVQVRMMHLQAQKHQIANKPLAARRGLLLKGTDPTDILVSDLQPLDRISLV